MTIDHSENTSSINSNTKNIEDKESSDHIINNFSNPNNKDNNETGQSTNTNISDKSIKISNDDSIDKSIDKNKNPTTLNTKNLEKTNLDSNNIISKTQSSSKKETSSINSNDSIDSTIKNPDVDRTSNITKTNLNNSTQVNNTTPPVTLKRQINMKKVQIHNDSNEKTIYVRGICQQTTEEELRSLFNMCGQIERVTIVRNSMKNNQNFQYPTMKQPLCVAYIEFESPASMTSALAYNETLFKGRFLYVVKKRVKPKSQKSGPKR